MGFQSRQSLTHAFNAEKTKPETVFVFDLDCALLDTRPLYEQIEKNAALLLMDYTDMTMEQALDATMDALHEYNGYVREAFRDKYGIPLEETVRRLYDPSTLDFSNVELPKHIVDILESIEGKVYLYTNSTEAYGRGILSALEIDHHFDDVFGTDSLDHLRKPDERSFQLFMDKTGAKPENIWFFEDSIENLQMAKSLGWGTILITEFMSGNLHEKERQELSVNVDRILDSLGDLIENDDAPNTPKRKPKP